MWKLEREDLADLSVGARLLGSGGAGDPSLGRLLLETAWGGRSTLPILTAQEIPADAVVISVGLVGSVTALGETPPAGPEFAAALARLIDHLGRPSRVLVAPYETAGVNALLPLVVAAQLGIDIADVDGMGRGLSWIDQTTYDVDDVDICPFVLTSPSDHVFIVEAMPGDEAERYVRSLTFQMGGWSAFAGYPMTRAQCARSSVHGSLRRCLDLGRRHRATVAGGPERFTTTPADDSAWRQLARGRVSDVRWRYPHGYPRGTIVVRANTADRRPIRIEASNEFLLVVDAGRVVAEVPEIICLLQTASGVPLLAERVVVGLEVDLIVLDAPHRWLEERFRERVGVARFGVDVTGGGA